MNQTFDLVHLAAAGFLLGPAVANSDTRERILDTAERLFAELGVDATSLRAVTRQAGVNLAAVHYHLGSKEALLEAVLARRVGPVNQSRLKALDQLEAAAAERPVPLEAILRAFFEPALLCLETDERGLLLSRLLSRLYWEAGPELRAVVVEQFGEVVSRFVAALERSLAPMPAAEVLTRFHYGLGVMIHVLARPAMAAGGPLAPPDESPSEQLARVVAFVAAGMRAPVQKIGERT